MPPKTLETLDETSFTMVSRVPIPNTFFKDTTRIARLTKYVLGAKQYPGRGRVYDLTGCAIFWPDITDSRYYEKICSLVYASPSRFRQETNQIRASYPPEKRAKAFQASLRVEAEYFLGARVLPQGAGHATKLISDYAAMCGVINLDDRLSEHYFNPENYTCFRRTSLDTHALLRPILLPPLLPPTASSFQDVPEALMLLYAAWTRATQLRDRVDPLESGIDFAKNGYIFVNWRRFLTSPYAPKHTLLPGEVEPALLKLKPYCAVERTLIPRDLDSRRIPPPSTAPLDKPLRTLSLYLELCMLTEAFEYDEVAGTTDPATLFDPIVLLRKPQVFDGRWHYRRAERVRETYVRVQQAKKDGTYTPAVQNTHVHKLLFRPMDYLQDLPPTMKVWFPPDTVENIYAIRRKGSLCFTNPPSLGQATPSEHEVWKRVIDSVKLLETIHETEQGSVVNVQEQCKSKFFSEARREHLERFLSASAEEALSYDTASKKRIKAAKSRAAQAFSQQTGQSAEMWYHHGVLPDAVAQLVNSNTYRRVANVVIPEQEDQGVQPRHFFTAAMLVLMRKFAQAATLRDSKAYEPDLEVVMTNSVGPAPYILAWSRFCLQMQKVNLNDWNTGPSPEKSKNRWTPAEDLALLTHYRRYPRLKTLEWKHILTTLSRRDKASCRTRAAQIRAVIEKGVSKSTAEHLRVGVIAQSPETARRLVFLYGYIRTQLKQPGFSKRSKRVQGLTTASNDWVAQLVMPASYGDLFRVVVDG